MKIYNESDMTKGWFIGDFIPTAYRSRECEVALKRYKTGDHETAHVHKIATEITMVVEGKVKMNGSEFSKGSIVVLDPGETTDFQVLENATTIVVKLPSVKEDKYDIHRTSG